MILLVAGIGALIAWGILTSITLSPIRVGISAILLAVTFVLILFAYLRLPIGGFHVTRSVIIPLLLCLALYVSFNMIQLFLSDFDELSVTVFFFFFNALFTIINVFLFSPSPKHTIEKFLSPHLSSIKMNPYSSSLFSKRKKCTSFVLFIVFYAISIVILIIYSVIHTYFTKMFVSVFHSIYLAVNDLLCILFSHAQKSVSPLLISLALVLTRGVLAIFRTKYWLCGHAVMAFFWILVFSYISAKKRVKTQRSKQARLIKTTLDKEKAEQRSTSEIRKSKLARLFVQPEFILGCQVVGFVIETLLVYFLVTLDPIVIPTKGLSENINVRQFDVCVCALWLGATGFMLFYTIRFLLRKGRASAEAVVMGTVTIVLCFSISFYALFVVAFYDALFIFSFITLFAVSVLLAFAFLRMNGYTFCQFKSDSDDAFRNELTFGEQVKRIVTCKATRETYLIWLFLLFAILFLVGYIVTTVNIGTPIVGLVVTEVCIFVTGFAMVCVVYFHSYSLRKSPSVIISLVIAFLAIIVASVLILTDSLTDNPFSSRSTVISHLLIFLIPAVFFGAITIKSYVDEKFHITPSCVVFAVITLACLIVLGIIFFCIKEVLAGIVTFAGTAAVVLITFLVVIYIKSGFHFTKLYIILMTIIAVCAVAAAVLVRWKVASNFLLFSIIILTAFLLVILTALLRLLRFKFDKQADPHFSYSPRFFPVFAFSNASQTVSSLSLSFFFLFISLTCVCAWGIVASIFVKPLAVGMIVSTISLQLVVCILLNGVRSSVDRFSRVAQLLKDENIDEDITDAEDSELGRHYSYWYKTPKQVLSREERNKLALQIINTAKLFIKVESNDAPTEMAVVPNKDPDSTEDPSKQTEPRNEEVREAIPPITPLKVDGVPNPLATPLSSVESTPVSTHLTTPSMNSTRRRFTTIGRGRRTHSVVDRSTLGMSDTSEEVQLEQGDEEDDTDEWIGRDQLKADIAYLRQRLRRIPSVGVPPTESVTGSAESQNEARMEQPDSFDVLPFTAISSYTALSYILINKQKALVSHIADETSFIHSLIFHLRAHARAINDRDEMILKLLFDEKNEGLGEMKKGLIDVLSDKQREALHTYNYRLQAVLREREEKNNEFDKAIEKTLKQEDVKAVNPPDENAESVHQQINSNPLNTPTAEETPTPLQNNNQTPAATKEKATPTTQRSLRTVSMSVVSLLRTSDGITKEQLAVKASFDARLIAQKAIKADTDFVDETFPQKTMIEGPNVDPNKNLPDRGYTVAGFMRFRDIHSERLNSKSTETHSDENVLQLYSPAPHPDNVRQGRLGDCWLISSIATICTKPEWIEKCFSEYNVKKGVYALVLHPQMIQTTVVVDDIIPVMRVEGNNDSKASHLHAPLFADSSNFNESWVSILEKGFAKLYSGYEFLRTNHPHIGMSVLTGGFPERIPFITSRRIGGQLVSTTIPVDELWARLEIYESKQYFIAAGTPGQEEIKGNGLILGHAYSVVKIRQHKDTRLVMLRNPWGKINWTGPFSNSSKKDWTLEMQNKFERADPDKGYFWMNVNDFAVEFDQLYACKIIPNWWTSNPAMIAEWNKTNCISSSAGYFASDAPQFDLLVKEDTAVSIILSQSRLFPTEESKVQKDYLSIGLFILRQVNGNKRIQRATKQLAVEIPSKYTNLQMISLETTLKAGSYTLVPAAAEAMGPTGAPPVNITLKVYSAIPVICEPLEAG
ncbi:Calpain-type cysteine protease [Blattamonas nauphoetae]|uniref:Calpain-type cysteine protease n=1 Tax=Blattamonas nauphoetae TaxID=2049346 RepID=A0ABQ9YK54_9EUKA|nr:Calpain-type cysteine protease [Blattamonas nauphoetae]